MRKFCFVIVFVILIATVLFSCDDGSEQDVAIDDKSIVTEDFKNYSLEYVSNGDGTCYVSKIINEWVSEEMYELVIPDVSPNGDKVIEVKASLYKCFAPLIMTEEDFKKMEENLQKKVDNEEISLFDMHKILSFYTIINPSDATNSEYEYFMKQYPFANCMADFRVIDSAVQYSELSILSESMLGNADYDMKKIEEIYTHLYDVVENTITDSTLKNEILNSLPKVSYGFGNNITAIKLPKGIEKISASLFTACTNITEINLPSSMSENKIENYIFFGCDKLQTLTIPDGVTSIGDKSFKSCKALSTLNIPVSVTYLGDSLFGDNFSPEINYSGTKEQWNEIIKDEDWNRSYPMVIHCSDGDIIIESPFVIN